MQPLSGRCQFTSSLARSNRKLPESLQSVWLLVLLALISAACGQKFGQKASQIPSLQLVSAEQSGTTKAMAGDLLSQFCFGGTACSSLQGVYVICSELKL